MSNSWERLVEYSKLNAETIDPTKVTSLDAAAAQTLDPSRVTSIQAIEAPHLRVETIPPLSEEELIRATNLLASEAEIQRILAENRERRRLTQLEQEAIRGQQTRIAAYFQGAKVHEIPTSRNQEGIWLPEPGSARYYGSSFGPQGYIVGLTPRMLEVMTDPSYTARDFMLVGLNRDENPVDSLDVIRRGLPLESQIGIYHFQGRELLSATVGNYPQVFRDMKQDRLARRVLIFGGSRDGVGDPTSRLILDFKVGG